MKILKITAHWTPEEADCIYQFLDDFKAVLWENYGEDIIKMHQGIHDDEQRAKDIQIDFDDELVF